MKISKDPSVYYYQERLQKEHVKDIKVFLKKKKKKKQQHGRERYKSLQENEKQSWLSIEKIL